MFTYCKRGTNENFSTVPFSYHNSVLNTDKSFPPPPLCRNIQMPFVSGRGLPRHLLDAEARLKGQDKSIQPFCANQAEEYDMQFSTLKWLLDVPMPIRGAPIPCAPTPVVEMRTSDNNACRHALGVRPCGGRCGCSPRCQCKEIWRGRNAATRPGIGQIRMHPVPGCVLK